MRRAYYDKKSWKPEWASIHERGFSSNLGPKSIPITFDGVSRISLINPIASEK